MRPSREEATPLNRSDSRKVIVSKKLSPNSWSLVEIVDQSQKLYENKRKVFQDSSSRGRTSYSKTTNEDLTAFTSWLIVPKVAGDLKKEIKY
jgi:hypothetical protein